MLSLSVIEVVELLPSSGSFILSFLSDDDTPSLLMDGDNDTFKKARFTREYTWHKHPQHGMCLYSYDTEEDKWINISPLSLAGYLRGETSQLIVLRTSGNNAQKYN